MWIYLFFSRLSQAVEMKPQYRISLWWRPGGFAAFRPGVKNWVPETNGNESASFQSQPSGRANQSRPALRWDQRVIDSAPVGCPYGPRCA